MGPPTSDFLETIQKPNMISGKNIDTETFGAPDISVSGLKIWISGRQFEDSTDYWDANWLVVTVHCSSDWSQVCAQGPIIHSAEIEKWLSELKNLEKRIHGEANLNCTEPELDVSIKLDKKGSGTLSVSITPDNLIEQHDFLFSIDQSYLPSLIRELRNVLKKYPIRESLA